MQVPSLANRYPIDVQVPVHTPGHSNLLLNQPEESIILASLHDPTVPTGFLGPLDLAVSAYHENLLATILSTMFSIVSPAFISPPSCGWGYVLSPHACGGCPGGSSVFSYLDVVDGAFPQACMGSVERGTPGVIGQDLYHAPKTYRGMS